MITISYWQIVVYTIAVFAGVYFIVERRVRQNNDVVSEFISLQNEKTKHILTKVVDDMFDGFEEVEERLIDLEDKNGRIDKENS